MKDPELKQKVEALLFSTGKKMTPDDLARIIRTRDKESIRLVLEELKDEYAGKPGSLFIVEEGEGYKLTVREGYQPVVRRVVADTELPKTVIETLAIIAWRAPVLQSDINKVRTNKVYDDVAILVGQGFISKTRSGRSYMLSLTQKFFDYFDLQGKEDFRKRFEKIVREKETGLDEGMGKIMEKKKILDDEQIKAESNIPDFVPVKQEKPLEAEAAGKEKKRAEKQTGNDAKNGQEESREAAEESDEEKSEDDL